MLTFLELKDNQEYRSILHVFTAPGHPDLPGPLDYLEDIELGCYLKKLFLQAYIQYCAFLQSVSQILN